jgi:hypothetical protein
MMRPERQGQFAEPRDGQADADGRGGHAPSERSDFPRGTSDQSAAMGERRTVVHHCLHEHALPSHKDSSETNAERSIHCILVAQRGIRN